MGQNAHCLDEDMKTIFRFLKPFLLSFFRTKASCNTSLSHPPDGIREILMKAVEMATKIFSSRPAGRKTKFRRKQAAAAASAPPSPPPAQRPLPQLPRWTLPFLWMSTVSMTSQLDVLKVSSSPPSLSSFLLLLPIISSPHQSLSSI